MDCYRKLLIPETSPWKNYDRNHWFTKLLEELPKHHPREFIWVWNSTYPFKLASEKGRLVLKFHTEQDYTYFLLKTD